MQEFGGTLTQCDRVLRTRGNWSSQAEGEDAAETGRMPSNPQEPEAARGRREASEGTELVTP